ncbi:predicted protein [Nematostella vectensis]|uniref:Pentacotripeptide-repeat region of PRORP domain-containing protein n=1 Tax=Nematostella vectensis TaxID=45351 RepID=A7RJQ7_NEMVE|nr:predicted protein [Nematostella vectensis]|eukprot:XP_001640481.1 predicted protein [Nematostella vectensis]
MAALLNMSKAASKVLLIGKNSHLLTKTQYFFRYESVIHQRMGYSSLNHARFDNLYTQHEPIPTTSLLQPHNETSTFNSRFSTWRGNKKNLFANSSSIDPDDPKNGAYVIEEGNDDDDFDDDDVDNDGTKDFFREKDKLKKFTSKNMYSEKRPNHKAQKTVEGKVRSSRYVFKDLHDGEEDFRWVRRQGQVVRSRRKGEWYANQMSRLANQNQIEKAEEMLLSMKQEGITQKAEVINILISAYAKKGNARKAFHLYNNIKKMGLKATTHTYTSLFNCCALSNNTKLTRASLDKLWEEFHLRVNTEDIKPHTITYNAAIKAFAHCSTPLKAFEVYEDMQTHGVQVDGYTSAALLAACAAMGRGGPAKAMLVLEEMKEQGVKLDIYVFNLVLKVIRDAKFDHLKKNPEKASITFEKQHKDSILNGSFGGDIQNNTGTLGDDHRGLARLDVKQNTKAEQCFKDLIPAVQEVPKNSVFQTKGKTSPLGVNLFAGVESFVQLMAVNEVKPDIRTFHLMLQLANDGVEQENNLLQVMERCGISPDMAMLNTLVRRRARKGDVTTAKEYIENFRIRYSLSADERTYVILASGCRTTKDGLWLLQEMKDRGLQSSQAVYMKLLFCASRSHNYPHMITLLKVIKKEGIQPLDGILSLMDKICYHTQKGESKRDVETNKKLKRKAKFLQTQRASLLEHYSHWRQGLIPNNDVDLDDTEEKNYDHL